jgi:alkaline phosphatase D
MLGDLRGDGASVWVRTLNPAAVHVEVQVNGEVKTFGPVNSSFASDLSAIVKVTGLPAGTSCPYKVFVDGKSIAAPDHAAITTPSAAVAAPMRIVFGTCQHRWGLANEKMAVQIIKRKPQAFLNYGDIAVQDRQANFGMQRADYALRDFHPAWKNIVSAIPVYASWDDHDYAKNDGWGLKGLENQEGRKGTRKIFAQSWCNPYYGLGDEGGGIFQHTRIGPCDIIMTDNRYFREPEGKYCFFGKEQMAWLKQRLLSSQGPFIILSCGTMWFDYVSGGKDGIGKFDPEAKEEIFNFIEENKIPGVLLISGDRHGARVFKTKRPSGFEFYEFEPASLGGRSGPPAKIKNCGNQLFGISGRYAFGEFTFDTARQDPEVTFRLIGDDGEILY